LAFCLFRSDVKIFRKKKNKHGKFYPQQLIKETFQLGKEGGENWGRKVSI
jgi:hypothetical protein